MNLDRPELIVAAAEHKGEKYVYGANVDFLDPEWRGPWDCAEFVSWLVYQEYEVILGCLDNEAPIADLEPFTGGWRRDIANENGIIRVKVQEAYDIVGAILLRYPQRKHVVISDGRGGTWEAMGRDYGVCQGRARNRGWNYAGVVKT